MEDFFSVVLAIIIDGVSILMLSYADYLAAQNQASGGNPLALERFFQFPWKGSQSLIQWVMFGLAEFFILTILGLLSIWLLITFAFPVFLILGVMLLQDKFQVTQSLGSGPLSLPQRKPLGPSSQTAAYLYGLRGEYKHQRLSCHSDSETHIGRSHENNISLKDGSVSGHHACVIYANGVWFIQDRSRYGTFVNGKQVKASRLENGDRVRIGSSEFEFKIDI